MRLWIDTEFNGFRGELISLALVTESGSMLYLIRKAFTDMDIDPWVLENVIPYLGENPLDVSMEWVDDTTGKATLEKFLSRYDDIEIISDWPEDVAHLCQYMITGPGYMIDTVNKIKFTIDRTLDGESEVPHNALYDALGNMAEQLNREYMQRERDDVTS